ncbi:MAG: hypothetical protein ABIA59_05230, partial [Candidatus Latescibacterota bacterium]
DSRVVARDDATARLDGAKNATFEFREIELNFNAYLNPFARADVFIGIHGTEGPVEVEEASATVLRGLPLSMQFKVGKYLLDFGKINTQHAHQWAWLEYPLMHQSFLGPEGARVVGANLSTMKPLGDNAITLSANAFQPDFVHHHSEDEHHLAIDQEEEQNHESPVKIGFSSRLSVFRSLTDHTSFETGLCYLYAETDPQEQLARNIAAFDVKLKWRPDMYRALAWIFEAMYSDRVWIHTLEGQNDKHSAEAKGMFSALEYRFRRVYDFGVFGDYAEDAVDSDMASSAFGAFAGYMPAEETMRFSLVYRHEESDLLAHAKNSITFQVVWALGPHKPHSF